MRKVNNYVRMGVHPQITVLPFNDQDAEDIAWIQKEVHRISGGRPYGVAIWRRVNGLNFPVIGESWRLSDSN